MQKKTHIKRSNKRLMAMLALAVAGGLLAHASRAQADSAVAWGYDNNGQLGNGTVGNTKIIPWPVWNLDSGVTAVAGGGYHSLAIQNGALYAWGYNSNGQLGDGTTTTRTLPTAVSYLSSGVIAVAAGAVHSLAIWNGAVFAWGYNGHGELGNGTTTRASLLQM